MIIGHSTPAPVGPQEAPTRVAASDSWRGPTPRRARGPPVDYGDGLRRA